MKKLLMRLLGVDEMVRKAFYEGWHANSDNLDAMESLGEKRLHVDEAWFNSYAEELV